MPLHLLDLPPELLTHALSSLPISSLLSATATCKALHALPASSAALQYTIKLASTGHIDSPDVLASRVVPAERLARLRAHERAWRELDVKGSRSVPLGPSRWASGIYDLSGGVYFLGERGAGVGRRRTTRAVRWMRLPRARAEDPDEGLSPPAWHRIDVGEDIVDIGVNVLEHDLIAIVTTKDAPDAAQHTVHPHQLISIQLLQLSTGLPHPLARTSVLPMLSARSSFGRCAVMLEISGDTLVLLVTFPVAGSGARDQLWVVNWKTGQKIAYGSASWGSYSGFVFLAHDALMLPNIHRGTLDLFRLPPPTLTTGPSSDPLSFGGSSSSTGPNSAAFPPNAPPPTVPPVLPAFSTSSDELEPTLPAIAPIGALELPRAGRGCKILRMACRAEPNPRAPPSSSSFTPAYSARSPPSSSAHPTTPGGVQSGPSKSAGSEDGREEAGEPRPFEEDPAEALVLVSVTVQDLVPLQFGPTATFEFVVHRAALLAQLEAVEAEAARAREEEKNGDAKGKGRGKELETAMDRWTRGFAKGKGRADRRALDDDANEDDAGDSAPDATSRTSDFLAFIRERLGVLAIPAHAPRDVANPGLRDMWISPVAWDESDAAGSGQGTTHRLSSTTADDIGDVLSEWDTDWDTDAELEDLVPKLPKLPRLTAPSPGMHHPAPWSALYQARPPSDGKGKGRREEAREKSGARDEIDERSDDDAGLEANDEAERHVDFSNPVDWDAFDWASPAESADHDGADKVPSLWNINPLAEISAAHPGAGPSASASAGPSMPTQTGIWSVPDPPPTLLSFDTTLPVPRRPHSPAASDDSGSMASLRSISDSSAESADEPDAPEALAWREWGPGVTAWFGDDAGPLAHRWITTSCGQRYARLARDTDRALQTDWAAPRPEVPDGREVRVFDFNRTRVARARARVEAAGEMSVVGAAGDSDGDGANEGAAQGPVRPGRFAALLTWSEGLPPHRTYVLDVEDGPTGVRDTGGGSGGYHPPGSSHLELGARTLETRGFFAEPVRGALPYVEVRSAEQYPFVSVLLDGEWIIGLNTDGFEEVASLEVLHFR